jgi:hypothetical protein
LVLTIPFGAALACDTVTRERAISARSKSTQSG